MLTVRTDPVFSEAFGAAAADSSREETFEGDSRHRRTRVLRDVSLEDDVTLAVPAARAKRESYLQTRELQLRTDFIPAKELSEYTSRESNSPKNMRPRASSWRGPLMVETAPHRNPEGQAMEFDGATWSPLHRQPSTVDALQDEEDLPAARAGHAAGGLSPTLLYLSKLARKRNRQRLTATGSPVPGERAPLSRALQLFHGAAELVAVSGTAVRGMRSGPLRSPSPTPAAPPSSTPAQSAAQQSATPSTTPAVPHRLRFDTPGPSLVENALGRQSPKHRDQGKGRRAEAGGAHGHPATGYYPIQPLRLPRDPESPKHRGLLPAGDEPEAALLHALAHRRQQPQPHTAGQDTAPPSDKAPGEARTAVDFSIPAHDDDCRSFISSSVGFSDVSGADRSEAPTHAPAPRRGIAHVQVGQLQRIRPRSSRRSDASAGDAAEPWIPGGSSKAVFHAHAQGLGVAGNQLPPTAFQRAQAKLAAARARRAQHSREAAGGPSGPSGSVQGSLYLLSLLQGTAAFGEAGRGGQEQGSPAPAPPQELEVEHSVRQQQVPPATAAARAESGAGDGIALDGAFSDVRLEHSDSYAEDLANALFSTDMTHTQATRRANAPLGSCTHTSDAAAAAATPGDAPTEPVPETAADMAKGAAGPGGGIAFIQACRGGGRAGASLARPVSAALVRGARRERPQSARGAALGSLLQEGGTMKALLRTARRRRPASAAHAAQPSRPSGVRAPAGKPALARPASARARRGATHLRTKSRQSSVGSGHSDGGGGLAPARTMSALARVHHGAALPQPGRAGRRRVHSAAQA